MKDAKTLGEKLGYICGTVIVCCVMALLVAVTLKLLFLIF